MVVQALALLAFDVAMLGLSFMAKHSSHSPAVARQAHTSEAAVLTGSGCYRQPLSSQLRLTPLLLLHSSCLCIMVHTSFDWWMTMHGLEPFSIICQPAVLYPSRTCSMHKLTCV